MIEMLGVLAIIGVLSVGGIAGYSKAMMKFKTNKTIDQIAMTVTNIRTLYAQQNTYNGLSDKNAYDMGVVDDAMVSSSEPGKNTLKNPFANAAGSVLIGTAASGAQGTGSHGAFIVTFTGLPREACVAIATNDWGSGYSSGFLGIYATNAASYDHDKAVTALSTCNVNATKDQANATTGSALACNGSGPLKVANAADGCDCENNNCSISLKYY